MEDRAATKPEERKKTGVVCMVPARGGSKRLPRKNVRLLKGKPLIAWSIQDALAAGVFDNVYISTDDEEIGRIGQEYGATLHIRDKAAATDTAMLQDVVRDFESRSGTEYETLIVLNPTNPLRGPALIRDAVNKFMASSATFLVCVRPQPMFIWERVGDGDFVAPISGYGPHHNTLSKYRTQDVPPTLCETGAIYGLRRGQFDGHPCTRSNTVMVEVNQLQAVDIDTDVDFIMAELLVDKLLADAQGKD